MNQEVVKAAHFGFVVEEVEAYGAVIETSDAAINEEGAFKMESYNSTFKEAEDIGMKDNRYTSLAPADLTTAFDSLKQACATRKTAYDAELALQRANDALDQEFAKVVDGLNQQIEDFRTQVGAGSSQDLEVQEMYVRERLADTTQSEQLPQVKALDDKLKAADWSIRHTTLSALDIDIAWENYQKYLEAKSKSLKEEIQHKELRGVSPEDYANIESQFKQFDTDGTGTLERNEFKACLYSLGEEKPKKEVLDIITKFGDGAKIPYDGFKEFMMHQLGDTDTKEEIVDGFALMHQGAEVAKEEVLLELFADADVDWIKGEAPKIGDDLDYKSFSEQVFAR